jgi:GntR family transcriptional repressor for pyruvate dehydrogenase complex
MDIFSPLSRQTVTEEALERVKAYILSGKLKEGDQLPTEIQLSEMLGISRNTVREVFITLQAQGFIEIRRGKGAFIADRSSFYQKVFIDWFRTNNVKIQQLLEVRTVLEPATTQFAAQNITDEEISELEEIHRQFSRAIRAGDTSESVANDERFHLKIFEASRNEMLVFLYTNIMPSLHEYRVKVFSPPAKPLIAIPAHENILEALRARDSSRAFQAMLSHIEETKADVVGIARSIESLQQDGD